PPLDAELPHLSLAREHAQDAFERSYVQEAMRRADGSISEAARLSGVSRQFFQRLLRKHGMR
ncbi:MAG TPA: helix-turn-helix domain-containing protein, partial [Myxococcales bacterium]|nr:helix-turn-helix domain-containing protein [Myxococcales bacterium]